MTTIALATSRAHADLTPDDRALTECLFKLGLEVRPLIWDEPRQQLDGVSTIVVRSCWDYHYKPQDFLQWAQNLESRGIAIHNSPRILRWNHDKNYLRQLESVGVSVPATAWFEAGSKTSLSGVLAERAGVRPSSNQRFPPLLGKRSW